MRRLLVLLLLPLGLIGCAQEEEILTSTTSSELPSTTSTTADVAPVTIDVTVGVDSGEERIETVGIGTKVVLRLTNPTRDDEFHLHGYDLSAGETPKGETATISFTADEAGEFEVESHVTEQVVLVVLVK